ncbi:DNA primase [Metabacillus iocasae]|uniref:DNA primase n=1 Tax=Priestia iocasae TaxID=2291674 RepID=A0ABS2QRW1_9BACI|nr:DNA primase [Metabacillus iocasae]MBM7701491.1 DNA primase [Metabacillus iocasae]
MTNRIPDEVIDRIRHSVDIVDVISDYVQLKKQGRNYFGLCPFHGESTPSFSVSPEKQIYHCFGCGAGGNSFSFLMELEGLSFVEAAQQLADKADIPFEHDVQPETSLNENKPTTRMVEAHELLKKFYHHLLVNTKEGQQAYDYLIERGFSRETIDEFEIGFSLDSWEFMTKFLTKRGFQLTEMEKAGLLVKRAKDGAFFDRFRGRVMFPIADLQGKTVAFSGRLIENIEGQPKYLNSPETAIFNKGKTIYNFHRAKKHIRKNQQVLLFEGFADVISAVKAECPNAIATMGTALTDEQAKIIRRNVESVVICYDSDHAGIEAAYKAANILTSVGCTVKVAVMPQGYDPDDYIKEQGPERFRNEVIDGSLTFMSFKMRYLRRGKNLQNEAERMKYIEDVLKEISQLTKAVEQEHYLRQLSQEFSISLDALQQQKNQISSLSGKKKDNDAWNRNNIARQPSFQTRLLPAYQNAERLLIAYMLKDKDVAIRIQELIQGNFNIEEHRALVMYIYAFYEEGYEPNLSLFMEKLVDGKLGRLASEIAMLSINEELSEQALHDYVQQVLIHPKLLKIKEKETEKQEAERQKDYLKAASIAMEIIQLKKALKS